MADGLTMSLAPMTQATSVVGEFGVHLVHLEHNVVRDIGLGEQAHSYVPAGGRHGMDGKLYLDALFFEHFDHFGQ
jgi:hypothetical protein